MKQAARWAAYFNLPQTATVPLPPAARQSAKGGLLLPLFQKLHSIGDCGKQFEIQRLVIFHINHPALILREFPLNFNMGISLIPYCWWVMLMYQNRIRDLREDRDLKQKHLAELLQVHQTTYSDYELGQLNIPVSALHTLADFYGVSVDYLLGRTDEPKPYPARK